MTVERLQRNEVNISMFKEMPRLSIDRAALELLKLPLPNIVVIGRYSAEDLQRIYGHRAYLNKPAWDKLTELYSQGYDPDTFEKEDVYTQRTIKTAIDSQTQDWGKLAKPTVDLYNPVPESWEELANFYKIEFGYSTILPNLEETYNLVVGLFPE